MHKSISIVGNIEDKKIIEEFVEILNKREIETNLYFPQHDTDAYIAALESYNLVICITPNTDKACYDLANVRPTTDMETVSVFLEITLLNPKQKANIDIHKTVEYTGNLNNAADQVLKMLGIKPNIEVEDKPNEKKDKEDSSFIAPPIPQEIKEEKKEEKQKEEREIIESSTVSTNNSSSFVQTPTYEIYEEPKKKRTGLMIGVILAVICLGGAIFGWFYYDNVYLPEKIDREAPRTYPMVNVFLRSSKMAGGDFNKIATLPGSDELITYEDDGEWAKVKYIPHGENAKPMVGYVASDYLLNKRDLYQLTSMLSDNDVREVLATSKVRKGLIDYYNRKGITGKISQENAQEVGLPYSPSDQWQVMFHRGQTKPNEVYFKRVYNPDSKFTDMAVIIENVSSGAKKLLYFTYDDDETPHLRAEGDYHNGVIKDMKLDSGVLQIIDKDGQISYYQIS